MLGYRNNKIDTKWENKNLDDYITRAETVVKTVLNIVFFVMGNIVLNVFYQSR